MTRRRFAPFLLGLFLLTSAIVTRIALAHFRFGQGETASNVKVPVGFELFARAKPVSFLPTALSAPSSANAVKSAPLVFTLSSESSAQLAEQIELNGLAEQAGLNLSASELKAFAEVTALHQAIRDGYELEIASVVRTAEGNPRLEIPLYSEAGDALRASFYADLRDAVGVAAAAKIEAKVGRQLESLFGGFGVAEQSIDLPSATPELGKEPVLQRTVVYWNPLAGADHHLLTRRETYFPRLEDAAGRSLAVVRSLFGADLSAGRL
jgi:hypothetical protein